ncbi:hypothetical protein D9758_011562 [Tetrapyrgos nigripes]|uniref:Transforming growth factor beta regulator 1 n=1 Tax=Tetrapyrgos nigripes TaxID=182062 RepID=A0A8H5CNA5_9AGAR|nr:hypothetical protein D9758_011562 [Tetrapyrgos nigripes]
MNELSHEDATAPVTSSSQVPSSQRDADPPLSPSANKRLRLDDGSEQLNVSEQIRVTASSATLNGSDDSLSNGMVTAAGSGAEPLSSSYSHPSSSTSQHTNTNGAEVNGSDTPPANETGRRVSKRRAAAANKVESDRVVTPRRSTRKSASASTESPVRTITENRAETPGTNAEAGSSMKLSDMSSSQSNQTSGPDKSNVSTAPNSASSVASSSTSTTMPSSGPGSLSSNPYSVFLTSPPPGVPAFNPYANPYLYMASLAAFPGMHPGMHAMQNTMPGMFGGATTAASSSSSPPTQSQPQNQQKPIDNQQRTKPKRLKAHTVKTKNVSIPTVPRDKNGKPMLPLNVGIMTVISLGEVCMREHFHSERYIYPVGYEVTRRYSSTINPGAEVVYHCTILDGGDGPKFQIVPSDIADKPVIASTATGAWSSIVKQANTIRNRQHSNSVSGPDFFGLGQNTIKHLIQELPNANKLKDYVWQNFVEGGPLGGRHAAVIPALPEEYDHSMPIGAYYPTAQDRQKRDASAAPETPRTCHYPPHIMAQQRSTPPASQHPQHSPSPAPPQPGTSQMHHPSPQGPPLNQPFPISQPMPLSQATAQHVPQMVLPHQPVGTPNGLHIQHYQPPRPSSGQAAVFSTAAPPPIPPTPATIASIMHAYPADGIPNGTPSS